MRRDVLDLQVDEFDESLNRIVLLHGHTDDTLKVLQALPITIDLTVGLHEQLLSSSVDTVQNFMVASRLMSWLKKFLWIGRLATKI